MKSSLGSKKEKRKERGSGQALKPEKGHENRSREGAAKS